MFWKTEIFVNRNTGGNIRHAVRDILALDVLFSGTFQEVLVIHHTDCGSLRFTDESMKERLKQRHDPELWPEIDAIAWGGNEK